MDALKRRTPAGGPALEVEHQIEFARQLYGTRETAARAGYCGIARPPTAPAPRDPAVIARDLRHAAEYLAGLAGDFETGGISTATLAGADRLLVGAGRLILELRARGSA